MKKLLILLFAMAFYEVCLSQGLIQPSGKVKNDTDPIQQLRDYQSRRITEGDTIWLPQKLELFFWNGDSLEIKPTYSILHHNELGDLAELIFIDTYTHDSVRKYEMEYNNAEQIEYHTWFNYDSIQKEWVPDYRNYFEYDQWANISYQLMQNWNLTHCEWRDSLRALVEFVDTVIIKQYVNEQFINNEWKRYFGYKNEFITNLNGCVTETITLDWVPDKGVFRNFEKDTLLLNDDCTYHTLIRQRWDDFNEEWYNFEKYTDVEYLKYYGYPSHFFNKRIKQQVDWWDDDKWIHYGKDSTAYLDENLNSKFLYQWLWDGNSDWIHYLSFRYLCYENGDKQRATSWEYDGQQLALTYDDSLTYTYFKGALKEIFRVQLDIPTGAWYPASRAVYSDFFPFVIPGSGTGSGLDKQSELKIIPNPAGRKIKIKSDAFFGKVNVYNRHGQLCLHHTIAEKAKIYQLDISGLPAGVYIVTVFGKDADSLSGKLIVE